MTAEEVGKRIKYLREKKNLKKNTPDNLSGVSPTYIDKLENFNKVHGGELQNSPPCCIKFRTVYQCAYQCNFSLISSNLLSISPTCLFMYDLACFIV